MNPLEKRWLCAAGMVAPSIPVGWLSVAGQMAQQSPEYSKHLALLRKNSKGMANIRSFRGDATDLSQFADHYFDVTLSLGPMYHLYEADEVNRAIDEAIRVTKPGGVILFAFISVFAIMYANYFYGKWAKGCF